jgi:1-acyl-sn-glycerol-3-phosphate acyltransferase
MLSRFLPAPLVGVIGLLLYFLSITFIAFAVIITWLLCWLFPRKQREAGMDWIHQGLIPFWLHYCLLGTMRFTTRIEWQIQGPSDLKPNGWYLLTSNHQSWADIIVMEQAFYQKVAVIKFFMKKQLIWALPFVGVGCWLIDFPMLNRHSKEYLKKHPEKAFEDIEELKHACAHFKDRPVTMMTFAEGTRFTREKHAKQQSPYQHLLRPKAGGLSFVIDAMSDYLDGIIDATVIYGDGKTSFWDFLCGKVRKMQIFYRVIPMTPDLKGNYLQDEKFRAHFQQWINGVWIEKDKLITSVLQSKGESGTK